MGEGKAANIRKIQELLINVTEERYHETIPVLKDLCKSTGTELKTWISLAMEKRPKNKDLLAKLDSAVDHEPKAPYFTRDGDTSEVLEFVSRDSVDAAKVFLVKKGFDFDFVVGDPEDVCKRLEQCGVDVTVPRGPLVDHAARAGAASVFRYLATGTGKFSKATMSAAFAGGALEIIRLVEAKVSFASVEAMEAAEWAADALRRWNFEVAEWLLRERPDVFADAVASRVVWLAAAKARDLATLRTLPLPESKFVEVGAHFLALLWCG
jgi:hypothetical protein